jgi:hypothetical protein
MTGLIDALYCIKVMKKYRTYKGEKIGRLKRNIYGAVSAVSGHPDAERGKIVLFREEKWPEDSMTQLGEYKGMKQELTGKITIETPLSKKELKERKNLITTTKTIVCVPREYVTKIRIFI